MSGPMLEVAELTCGHGDIVAVDRLSLAVGAGEVFGLVGANGAGKSAILMALAGLLPVRSGTVRLAGRNVTAMPAQARIDQGIALVPEGRRVFADLNAESFCTSTRKRTSTASCTTTFSFPARSHGSSLAARPSQPESPPPQPPPGRTSSPRTFCPP